MSLIMSGLLHAIASFDYHNIHMSHMMDDKYESVDLSLILRQMILMTMELMMSIMLVVDERF
jgi:hypothetical protein